MKRLGTSLRGQSIVSEHRLGCLSPEPNEVQSALGAAPDIAVVDVGLNFLSPKNPTADSHEQKNEWPEHHLRTGSLLRFYTNGIYYCDLTKI